MTTILHPDWQPTDDERAASCELRAASVPPAGSSKLEAGSSATISRRPAAILGILLALSIGTVLLQDTTLLPGSLTEDAVTVTITSESFDPETVTVRAGQTIVWKNTSPIPHVMFSETLKDERGQPFVSSPIFQGTTGTFTIPAGTPPGTYPYISQTDTLSGTITVETAASPPPRASSAALPSLPALPELPGIPDLPPIDSQHGPDDAFPFVPSEDRGGAVPSPEGSPLGAGLIPRNPHTAGAGPAASGGIPLPRRESAPLPAYGTKGKPGTTPVTGPALWIVAGGSIAALLLLTRRCFRRG